MKEKQREGDSSEALYGRSQKRRENRGQQGRGA